MKNNNNQNNEPLEEQMQQEAAAEQELKDEQMQQEAAEAANNEADELEKTKAELAEQKKEYLFLMAEFDNFRKRTLKEKSELIKTAAEQALKGLLPVVDDFERGLKAAEETQDAASVKEGFELIYQKLIKYLEQNGVKAIDPEDRDFDTEKHEAISAIEVPDKAQKGKILDTVQKGYTINGKVMRHAKVVVGR